MDAKKLIAARDILRRRVRSLARTLEARKQELEELETAIKVMGKYLDVPVEEFSEGPEDKTIMSMIIEILTEQGCLPSLQILQIIRNKYKPDLERTSMSPQLSRLKASHKIDYVDGKWCLPKNDEIKKE